MDIEKLKQKILDLAIRGKLVPQDPNDEPASVLIEKIREEKAKLVKEGKIKASKEESYIYKGSDNCYYENYYSGWLLLPLKCVANITMGQSPNGQDIFCEKTKNSLEFHQGKLAFTDWLIGNSNKYSINYNKVAPCNSLIFCVRAPVGDLNYTDREIAIGRGLCAIKPQIQSLNTKFLYYILVYLKKYFKSKGTGSTFQAITVDVLKECIIPIPPINEQNKIVELLDKSFIKINEIDRERESISNLAEITKKRILDSVFGEDSSYKSYYKKVKLSTVCSLIKYQDSSNGNFPYLEAKVIRGTKSPKIISNGIFIKKGTRVILVDGENSGEIMSAPYDGYMGSTFKIINYNEELIDIGYLELFILYNKQKLKDNKTGSAIPHLNKKIFNSLELYLPSLEEQININTKINQSLIILNSIIS